MCVSGGTHHQSCSTTTRVDRVARVRHPRRGDGGDGRVLRLKMDGSYKVITLGYK